MSDFEYPSIDVGERIKARRKELGLTLQDLADHVHVARSTIQRYETANILRMKMPVLYSIAQALGVNPDWLVFKSDQKFLPDAGTLSAVSIEYDGLYMRRHHYEVSDSEFSLLCAYRKAPPEIRQAIDAILTPYSSPLPEEKKLG